MGPEEDCIEFDVAKERLWLTYVFYADRIPELYDFAEEEVFTNGPIAQFL